MRNDRLICCFIIIICSGFTGCEMRRRLYVRLHSLEMIRNYFRHMKSLVSHVGMSFHEIACASERTYPESEFCSLLREKTLHADFPSAFKETVSSLKHSLCLTGEDLKLLCSIADRIGGYDSDTATASLSYADEHLSDAIGSYREKLDTDGKLYVILGFSFGTVAALLLI